MLGAIIGLPEDRDDYFEERLNKLQALREDLADIDDAGVELLLGRLCANTKKVSHLLRARCCQIRPQLLNRFDESTATFVAQVLGGDLQKKRLNKRRWDSITAASDSEKLTFWRHRRTWPLSWTRAHA